MLGSHISTVWERTKHALPQLLLAGAFGALVGCGPTSIALDAGPSTPAEQTCSSVTECPDQVNYDCVGVCLRKCASDTVCGPAEFCNSQGYCADGCRNSSTCNDGEVCSEGSCVTGGAGCTSKCECATGQVCIDGACQSPPATCAGPTDCPRGPGDRCEAYQCNGFTQQCFDPDPQPCTGAADCTGRPGCLAEGDCDCNGSGQCVPAGECTVETEAAVCGDGFYCDNALDCVPLPACTNDSQCTPAGLVCNLGTSTCERPQPCTSSADCTAAPKTYCDTSVTPAACVIPNCQNGGVTCQAGQECAEDGRCVAQGTGTMCTSDADCPNAAWPNTQYCEPSTQQCAVGCRSSASCPSGQTCNGARQCVTGGGGGAGQWGATCMDDSGCQAGLICGSLTGTCAELCSYPGEACAGRADCCPLSGQPNCQQVLLFGYCRP